MAEPIGYVVACRTTAGTWVMESLGLWPTPEEAARDRDDAQEHGDAYGDVDRYFVCAVTPVEADGDG